MWIKIAAGSVRRPCCSPLVSAAASVAFFAVLDADHATPAYRVAETTRLSRGSETQCFRNIGGDAWSLGVTFTYQSASARHGGAEIIELPAPRHHGGPANAPPATMAISAANSNEDGSAPVLAREWRG